MDNHHLAEYMQSNRIDSIDGLRGLAALAVAVIYHYQHFGAGPPPLTVWFLSPAILQWLQVYGWLGVDCFFLLSGYIFAATYGHAVASRAVSEREFFVRRFARLYPLHLATLLATLVLVWTCYILTSTFPIYAINDPFHLVLNLLFLQHAGLQSGMSFNGPAWSLSIEALCYLVFFVACRAMPNRRIFAYGILAFAGAALVKINPPTMPLISMDMGRGLIGFFVGCLVFSAVSAGWMPWLRWVAVAVLGFVVAAVAATGGLWPLIHATFYLTFQAVILPAILIVVLGFRIAGAIPSSLPFRYIGEISYSIYLVHAVLQMVIIMLFRARGVTIPASQFWFFAAYASSLLALSSASYHLIERPAREYVRRRMSSETV